MTKIRNFTQFVNENFVEGGEAAKILKFGNINANVMDWWEEERPDSIYSLSEIAEFLGCKVDQIFYIESETYPSDINTEYFHTTGLNIDIVKRLEKIDVEGDPYVYPKLIVRLDGVEIPCVFEMPRPILTQLMQPPVDYWIYMFNYKHLYEIASGKKLKLRGDADFLDSLNLLDPRSGIDLFEE